MATETIADGVYAAALTPLHENLRCNSEQLAHHCLDLLGRGCSGVVLFGTTGEGASFSQEARKQVLDEVIQAGVDPKKIIVGNGSSGIDDTVALATAALSHGCAVLLIAPPSFYKNVKEEGVLNFYREIIQKVANPRLKVILYHIPQFTGVPITLKVIQTLCKEFPATVIGIKESEGNLAFAKAIMDAEPGFKVFVGNERHIIEAVHHGGAGSICGIANLYPELICSLYKQGKIANSQNPAELEAFFRALNGYHFVSAFKAVMEKRNGSSWHTLCPPLAPLTDEEKALFISGLQKAKLED